MAQKKDEQCKFGDRHLITTSLRMYSKLPVNIIDMFLDSSSYDKFTQVRDELNKFTRFENKTNSEIVNTISDEFELNACDNKEVIISELNRMDKNTLFLQYANLIIFGTFALEFLVNYIL